MEIFHEKSALYSINSQSHSFGSKVGLKTRHHFPARPIVKARPFFGLIFMSYKEAQKTSFGDFYVTKNVQCLKFGEYKSTQCVYSIGFKFLYALIVVTLSRLPPLIKEFIVSIINGQCWACFIFMFKLYFYIMSKQYKILKYLVPLHY
uniref:Uncharacterized protein n=1 Tax=Cacopsylla melanoneura TaxID=428564 RepID=A0A8D8QN28_9HEMI